MLHSSLDRLPEPLTAYLAGELAHPAGLSLELGGLAPRDGCFSATDFLISTRRPIGAGRSGDRWFLWDGHGGFGLHVHLVVVDLPPDAKALANMFGWPLARLCATTADILSGRASAVIGEEW